MVAKKHSQQLSDQRGQSGHSNSDKQGFVGPKKQREILSKGGRVSRGVYTRYQDSKSYKKEE